MRPTVTSGPGGVLCYDFGSNSSTVLVSTEDTNGAYSIVDDLMQPLFATALHIHRKHAQTFHLLYGALEFTLDGRTIEATTGATVHVPSGTAHAVRVLGRSPARALVVYALGGFERYLCRLAAMTAEESADPDFLRRLEAEHDIEALPASSAGARVG